MAREASSSSFWAAIEPISFLPASQSTIPPDNHNGYSTKKQVLQRDSFTYLFSLQTINLNPGVPPKPIPRKGAIGLPTTSIGFLFWWSPTPKSSACLIPPSKNDFRSLSARLASHFYFRSLPWGYDDDLSPNNCFRVGMNRRPVLNAQCYLYEKTDRTNEVRLFNTTFKGVPRAHFLATW